MLKMFFLLSVLFLCAVAASDVPSVSPPKNINITNVFYPGLSDAHCYRIPTIIRTNRTGVLLAFAEQRVANCGDGAKPNLVLRRSKDDGMTWEPQGDVIYVVKADPSQPLSEDLSNINPVEVAFEDPSSKSIKTKILVHYDTYNNPNPLHHGKNMQVWSYDNGLTWVENQEITEKNGPFASLNYSGCMPGPSVGVVVQNTYSSSK